MCGGGELVCERFDERVHATLRVQISDDMQYVLVCVCVAYVRRDNCRGESRRDCNRKHAAASLATEIEVGTVQMPADDCAQSALRRHILLGDGRAYQSMRRHINWLAQFPPIAAYASYINIWWLSKICASTVALFTHAFRSHTQSRFRLPTPPSPPPHLILNADVCRSLRVCVCCRFMSQRIGLRSQTDTAITSPKTDGRYIIEITLIVCVCV